MSRRPRSVTIICWILIIMGGMALLVSFLPPVDEVSAKYIAEYKTQHPFYWRLFYVGPVLAIICGVFMLLGFGWARWLLHAWFGHNLVMNVIHRPQQFLIGAVMFGIAVYYLYRPQAVAFFRARSQKL
jgi:hypothetical protein